MHLHFAPSGDDDLNLYYATSVRSGKKTGTKIVRKIGKLSELRKEYDDPVAHFREEARRLTAEEKRKKEEDGLFTVRREDIDLSKRRNVRLGYIFPQQVYCSLGLDGCMRKLSNGCKAAYDFCRIVRDLVCGRILDPLSKRGTYDLAQSFPEPPDYRLEDVYKALKRMAGSFDAIEEKAFRGTKRHADVDTSVTYYDCTNFYFETEEEDGFRCYGHSKENRPNPIVQMGLFLDRNGLPVSMCIHPGSTSEQKTMIPEEEKMRNRFGIRKFVVCADCGLSGKRNLRYNSDADHFFVVTKSLRKVTEEQRKRLMAEDGWKRFGDTGGRLYSLKDVRGKDEFVDAILYREEWFETGKDLYERVIVIFSERTRRYQESVRAGQVERAVRLMEGGRVKTRNQNDARRFVREDHATREGEAAERTAYSIDEDRIAEEARYDGFYAVTTDLSDDVGTVIRINKGRWEIEESFRILKGELAARPVFVSTEECIRAHFLCCYLSLLVFRVLEQRLEKAGKFVTAPEIVKAIQGYNVLDMGSFYAGAMEGETARALEEVTGLCGSKTAMSKAFFRALVKRSKGESGPGQEK